MKKQKHCPLAGIDKTVLTDYGFKTACIVMRAKDKHVCPSCETGKAVAQGNPYAPPEKMEIVKLSDLTELPECWETPTISFLQPGNYPWGARPGKNKNGRKPIYPFKSMKKGG